MSAHHLAELGVIIVAAGQGVRLGADRPKAFVELNGSTLLEHALRTVTSLPHAGQLVLVVPEPFAAEALEITEAASSSRWQVSVVGGGRERHESVRKGLEALGDTIQTVLVHDAARPLTPTEVFERVIAEVHEHRCAVIPVTRVFDTLKATDADGIVLSTVDRNSLVGAQTPQGFVREELQAAHQTAQLHAERAPLDAPSDDAEVVQRAGGTVRTVAGSPFSHKVTTPEDLQMLEGLIRADQAGQA